MKFLDFLNDKVAMFAAIIVSLGTVTLMFVVITPDFLFYIPRLVMGAMGAILVLFSPRALVKRKIGLWRCIAALIVFAEVSTVLTMTDVQSHDVTTTVKVDPILEHLQGATTDARDNLTKFIDQQAKANNRATLDALADQIKTATAVYQSSQEAEKEFRGSSQARITGIDANALFMAIPTAVMSGQLSRWMTLVFSLIVAVVFQLVIVATVTATVKQVRRDDNAKKPKTRKRHRAVKVEAPVSEEASHE